MPITPEQVGTKYDVDKFVRSTDNLFEKLNDKSEIGSSEIQKVNDNVAQMFKLTKLLLSEPHVAPYTLDQLERVHNNMHKHVRKVASRKPKSRITAAILSIHKETGQGLRELRRQNSPSAMERKATEMDRPRDAFPTLRRMGYMLTFSVALISFTPKTVSAQQPVLANPPSVSVQMTDKQAQEFVKKYTPTVQVSSPTTVVEAPRIPTGYGTLVGADGKTHYYLLYGSEIKVIQDYPGVSKP